jgi:hypothetical protein
MVQHASTHRARLQLEHLEQHAVPIRLSTHITSDGSGGLSRTGVGSHLGRWTGQGSIENVVIDAVADRVAVSGTATMIAANGDQMFASFSASGKLTTGLGEVTVTFTGGAPAGSPAPPAVPPIRSGCLSIPGTMVFAHSR